jgi:hypothetical protein
VWCGVVAVWIGARGGWDGSGLESDRIGWRVAQGIVRNQFFFVGSPLLSQLSVGMFFIVTGYCAVEVAEPGSEGITYGFITTVGNLVSPLASLASSNLASAFNLCAHAWDHPIG